MARNAALARRLYDEGASYTSIGEQIGAARQRWLISPAAGGAMWPTDQGPPVDQRCRRCRRWAERAGPYDQHKNHLRDDAGPASTGPVVKPL